MAKTIKKIVCPQCGSNQVSETKKDHYICKGCNTQFFLDNDDITINHNYTPTSSSNKNILFLAIGILVVLGILGIASNLTSKSETSPRNIDTPRQIEKTTEPTEPKKKVIGLSDGKIIPLKDKQVVSVQYATISKDSVSKICVVVTDVLTKKIISQKYVDFDLSLRKEKSRRKGIEFIKTTLDNDLFLLIDEQYLLFFNSSTLNFEYLDDAYLSKHAELSSGVYTVTYNSFVEKFEIVNNKGKHYAYFPRIDKLYPKDKDYLIHLVTLPQGKLMTAFDFSGVSEDFPEEESQLVKYTYLYQPGYTLDFFKIEWVKDYYEYGIVDDSSPYRKVLIRAYAKERARIKSIQDFTPNRTYVNGNVVGYDTEGVMILIKHTIQSDETYTLQKISLKTKEILWNKKTSWKGVRSVFQINDLYFVEFSKGKYQLFDGDGNELTTFKDEEVSIVLED